MDTSVKLAAGFLLVLLGIGIFQAYRDTAGVELAAAAVVEQRNQQQINICMDECMYGCVIGSGSEQRCLDKCAAECRA